MSGGFEGGTKQAIARTVWPNGWPLVAAGAADAFPFRTAFASCAFLSDLERNGGALRRGCGDTVYH